MDVRRNGGVALLDPVETEAARRRHFRRRERCAARIPERLGPYRIGPPIGIGGMATVHRAWDSSRRRSVAIKWISEVDDEARLDRRRRRLCREARIQRALRHPRIVRLLEVSAHRDRPYLVLELIEGVSLGRLVANGGALDPMRAVRIALSIADALAHAHAHGIVHADLSPGNVLVDRARRAHLADLGLAREIGSAGRASGFAGTASYAAPEQCVGAEVSPRTDVYGLGAVLYFALAGRPPFLGASMSETAHAVVHGLPEPLRRLAPDVSSELQDLILECLEKDPRARPPGAPSVAGRLRHAVGASAPRSRARSRKRRRRIRR